MKKVLIVMLLAILLLSWNFIFSPSRKLDLTDPAKVLQGLSLAIKHKLAVRQFWKQYGKLPVTEDLQNLTIPQVDISQSLVTDIRTGEEGPGSITVYFSNKDVINVAADISGKKIILTPMIIDKRLDWTCRGDMQSDLMPKACSVIQ